MIFAKQKSPKIEIQRPEKDLKIFFRPNNSMVVAQANLLAIFFVLKFLPSQ